MGAARVRRRRGRRAVPRHEARAVALVRRPVRLRDVPAIVRALAAHVAGSFLGWDRRRLGTGAVVRDETGRVLVVRPSYRRGWTLPGGHVSRGEAPEEALAREVLEETGYRVEVGPLLVVDGREPGALVFVFAASVLDGRADPAPLEIRALDWVDEATATQLLELDRSRLRLALDAIADGSVRYLRAPTIEP